MILKTLLVALAGGAALWKLSGSRSLRKERAQPARKPHAENRWEGEGGALRESGAQLGPQPSVINNPG